MQVQPLLTLFLHRLAISVLLLMPGAACASHQKGTPPVQFAVVVGVADYDLDGRLDAASVGVDAAPGSHYADDLTASRNDSRRVAKALSDRGFKVHPVDDVDAGRLRRAMATFVAAAARAGPDDQLIFYYSGHSVQVEETLYLVPAGAKLVADPAAGRQGPAYTHRKVATEGLVPVTEFTLPARVANSAGYNLLFLDSCRNNPWPELAGRGVPDQSPFGYLPAVGSGLPNRAHGTVLALAAAPGTVAEASTMSSPFTDAFIVHMRDDDLGRILDDVGRTVSARWPQRPHVYTDPFRSACFGQCAAELATPIERISRAASGSPIALEAVALARDALVAQAAAREQAMRIDQSRPLSFQVKYLGMAVVGGDNRLPHVIVPTATAAVEFHMFESQDWFYVGAFQENLPHGLGELDFDCAVVFLRARCPLKTLQRYSGNFKAGLPVGPGGLWDALSGRHSLGRFHALRDDKMPVPEQSPQLSLGVASYPDGRVEAGAFLLGRLVEGIRIDAHGATLRGIEKGVAGPPRHILQ